MSQESSSTESVNTTTLTREPIQRESTKPSVPSAQQEDTSQTSTKSEKDKSYSDSQEPQPTPSELVSLGRPPYVTDLLEARMAYETFDVKEQLSEIDTFIRDGIEDARVAYEQVFRGIMSQVGEQDSVYTTIARMRDYVRLQNKISGIIKEREEFEAKSPEEMSADELKRYLNGR